MQLIIVPTWANLLIFTVPVVAAFVLGGWRERSIGSLGLAQYLAATALCQTMRCWSPDNYRWFEWRALVFDLTMLALCLAAARRGRSYWPLWASAFALLSVATDVTKLLVIGLSPWSHVSANNVWAYLLMATVLWGAVEHGSAQRMRPVR